MITEKEVAQFNKDGFYIARKLFDAEEMDLLLKIGKADKELAGKARSPEDASGTESRLTLWNQLDEDIYSAFVRCHRLVDGMELFLEGEVYHYHHKMMQKEPYVGGAWEWHQDYGYWYNNGCLFPHMASCMIAVDRATRENGCLQVIPGSHHLGRIDHGKRGGQTGADAERVEEILKRMEKTYVELDPGDAVFFHSNTLHRSDQNKSPNPRWTLICCYNAARNDPYETHHHPNYSYLEKWPDSRIKEIGRKQWAEIESGMLVG